jgi:signal transduction histidine kinase
LTRKAAARRPLSARQHLSLDLFRQFGSFDKPNPEAKDAIVLSLTEMQYITETTLSFARDETASEEPRMIDLASLVEAAADGLAAMGQNTTIAEHDHLHYRCRPALMRRALINLMSNATKYGKRARVARHFT